MKLKLITQELKEHAPFTAFGAFTGLILMYFLIKANLTSKISEDIFYILHPLHVFLSALATASLYKNFSEGKFIPTLLIGFFGAIGIATLSDSIIPFYGERLVGLHEAHAHIGFIEKWWLINPIAIAGAILAYFKPKTKTPHFGHVLLSTWASLFHVMIAVGSSVTLGMGIGIFVFIFLSVWLPCCVSDIVFPLLFANKPYECRCHHH